MARITRVLALSCLLIATCRSLPLPNEAQNRIIVTQDGLVLEEIPELSFQDINLGIAESIREFVEHFHELVQPPEKRDPNSVTEEQVIPNFHEILKASSEKPATEAQTVVSDATATALPIINENPSTEAVDISKLVIPDKISTDDIMVKTNVRSGNANALPTEVIPDIKHQYKRENSSEKPEEKVKLSQVVPEANPLVMPQAKPATFIGPITEAVDGGSAEVEQKGETEVTTALPSADLSKNKDFDLLPIENGNSADPSLVFANNINAGAMPGIITIQVPQVFLRPVNRVPEVGSRSNAPLSKSIIVHDDDVQDSNNGGQGTSANQGAYSVPQNQPYDNSQSSGNQAAYNIPQNQVYDNSQSVGNAAQGVPSNQAIYSIPQNQVYDNSQNQPVWSVVSPGNVQDLNQQQTYNTVPLNNQQNLVAYQQQPNSLYLLSNVPLNTQVTPLYSTLGNQQYLIYPINGISGVSFGYQGQPLGNQQYTSVPLNNNNQYNTIPITNQPGNIVSYGTQPYGNQQYLVPLNNQPGTLALQNNGNLPVLQQVGNAGGVPIYTMSKDKVEDEDVEGAQPESTPASTTESAH